MNFSRGARFSCRGRLCALQWVLSAIIGTLVLTGGLTAVAAGFPAPVSERALSAYARFYTPPLPPGATSQFDQLLASGQPAEARALARMVATPQALWLVGGTPSVVESQVRMTVAGAKRTGTIPILVAYDIPGRDCARYSAGGAGGEAAYERWIRGLVAGLGTARAIVVLEPDSLAELPSDCGLPISAYPYTDAARFAELRYAADQLERDQGASVYLDGGNSAWQPVGAMAQRLLEAGVSNTQGFFLNVSNYQPTVEEDTYGSWVSDCIDLVTHEKKANPLFAHPSRCESQYYPAQQDLSDPWQQNYATWGQVTRWYNAELLRTGVGRGTVPFIVDTSRNGQGPNDMTAYSHAPYFQSRSVVNSLAAGDWCSPPGAGTGLRPTADTGKRLVAAYLWIKRPGQSDGQCDEAGGVRAWDYANFSRLGWPPPGDSQQSFDPLWGTYDPTSGDWFPQEALQLAEDADPATSASQNR